ncbi:hypothetical protein SDC9_27531 [bioreactor metagenome]|uniref:Uncharacterized protein n=1 Tax=bioreactor metagenome TaxID=1076179 RepID=A0A644USC5_9ZZZZ
MSHNPMNLADLSTDQLKELKQFEAQFSSKHGKHIFFLAFGEKQ